MHFVDIELINIEKDDSNQEEYKKDMIVINENGSIEESLDEDWDQTPLVNAPFEQSAVKKSSFKSKFIYLVDVIFSAFVSSPISGFFWYTIWKFTEDYVHIYSDNMSYFICYFTGFIILAFAYILQDCLQNLFTFFEHCKYCNKILCFIMRNSYMYIITVAITVEWQGLWDLIESNIDDLQTKLSLSIIAITYACLTRSTRALVSTPFVLTVDDDSGFFEYELKSHSFLENSIFANFVLSEIIDCLVMVVGWVGFDNFFDYYFDSYLSPDISYYSLLLTFSSSHIVYLIIAFVQYPIYQFMNNRAFILQILVEHVMNIIMFISSILLWKFYWDLGDFFLRDMETKFKLSTYLFGNLFTFTVGVWLKITWVLPGPGVITFDGDHENKTSYYQIEYFSILLKKSERTSNGETSHERLNREQGYNSSPDDQTV